MMVMTPGHHRLAMEAMGPDASVASVTSFAMRIVTTPMEPHRISLLASAREAVAGLRLRGRNLGGAVQLPLGVVTNRRSTRCIPSWVTAQPPHDQGRVGCLLEVREGAGDGVVDQSIGRSRSYRHKPHHTVVAQPGEKRVGSPPADSASATPLSSKCAQAG